jgi:hypothetical protein
MAGLTPASAQAPPSAATDRARNELSFILGSTEAVLEPRRERGELQDEHAGVVQRAMTAIRTIVLDGFLSWYSQALLNLTARGLAAELPRQAAKARAELDSVKLPVDKLGDDAAIERANAWARRPDGYTIVATTPAPLDAGREGRLREVRDHFRDSKSQVIRRALQAAAQAGDDETVEAFATAPRVVKDEIFDEATMRKLGDIYLDRAGKRQEVESAEMAASLGNWVLDRARAAIDAVAGSVPTDLLTPDGRRVPRSTARGGESARLLRIDSQGNSVPVMQVDSNGNVGPITEMPPLRQQ